MRLKIIDSYDSEKIIHLYQDGMASQGRGVMTPDALIFDFTVSMLAALSIVALYSELRRKRFESPPSADRIFRCEKCAFVYTDDADVERSRCPQCGCSNHFIVF